MNLIQTRFGDIYDTIRRGRKNYDLRFLAGVPMVFFSFTTKLDAEQLLEQEFKPLLEKEDEFESSVIGPMAGYYFAVIVGPSS